MNNLNKIRQQANHCFQVNIYADDAKHAFEIAKAINQLSGTSILQRADWAKVREVFKVSLENAMGTWNKYISP